MLDSLRAAWRRTRGLDPGPTPEPRRIRMLLWSILAVALLARGLQAGEGLPYLHSWDEPFVTGHALHMLTTGNLDPDYFVYGTLPMYMDLVTDVFHYLWLRSRPPTAPPSLASLDEVRTGFDTGWLWDISHPSFYLWNRWLAALMGTGTVLLTYLIGRRIAGPWAGLAGAALLAGTAFHVEESAIGTVDNPMTFFVVLAAWAAVAFVQEGRMGLLLASLVACGLAVSSKLSAAVALLLPAAALALAGGKLPPVRRRLAWLAVPALPAAAFVAGSPYVVLNLRRFLLDSGRIARVYEAVPWKSVATEPGLGHLLLQLGTMAAHIGWITVPFILAGALLLVSKRAGQVLAIYGTAHALFVARSFLPYRRNFLVLYPLAAVAFGAGVVLLYRALARLHDRASPFPRHARTAAVVLVTAFLAWGQLSTLAAGARAWRSPESRSRAVVMANALGAAGKGNKLLVGIPAELRIHPDDLANLTVPHEVMPWIALVCDHDRYTHLMQPARWSAYDRRQRAEADLFGHLEPPGETIAADTGGAAPLLVDVLSLNPRVRLVALGHRDPGGGSPCLAAFSAADLALAGTHRASAAGELMMENAAPLVTPWLLADPGSYAVVLHGRGSPARGVNAKVRAEVLAGGEEGPPAAVEEFSLDKFPGSWMLAFDLAAESTVAVRLQLLNDFYSASTHEDRNAYISGIWIVRASGEAGGHE
jgi:hypothetical protein